MEKQQLRSVFIYEVLECANKYKKGIFHALREVSLGVFDFIPGWVKTNNEKYTSTYNVFKEHFFDFVLGDLSALTDIEFLAANRYYSGIVKRIEPPAAEADVLEKIKNAITNHRAEIEQITASTKKMRRIIRKANICPALDRINDFVRYDELVHSDGAALFYVELYELGRIDGIRQERSRRRRSAQV